VNEQPGTKRALYNTRGVVRFVPSQIIFKNFLSPRRMVGGALAWPLGLIYCASGELMEILVE
jgi:hypothetical protein